MLRFLYHNYRFYFMVFFSFTLYAQYPVDTIYLSIATPSASMPGLRQSLIDNSVPDPVQITRITEYNTQWDWYPTHEYAKIQPWNANATIYKFYSVAIYDARTFQLIRTLPGSEIYPSYWSNTDPDILYGFKENGDLKIYHVQMDSVELIDHIYFDSANHVDYDIFKLGPGEGNIDRFDRFVAFAAKKQTDLYVIVYDLQNRRIVTTKRFIDAWGNNNSPQYIDWVSVSQSGQYVGIMWDHNTTDETHPHNGHYGVEIYDSQNMQFLRRIARYGNHGDFGYDTSGREVFVQFWGETGTLNMYYLDSGERIVLSSHPDFGGEGHISCRNLQRPGYAYVSQDDRSGQMVAVRLDTTGRFEHFGHHFSSAENYTKSPMPCPSPDGTKVMFKSDFGQANDPDLVYTFIAQKAPVNAVSSAPFRGWKLYPNPVRNILHFSLPVHRIILYDSTGKQILNISLETVTYDIDLSILPPGTYFIRTDYGTRLLIKR